jgi:hypothetical protein
MKAIDEPRMLPISVHRATDEETAGGAAASVAPATD